MISSRLEIILNKAIKLANVRKHEFLTLESVLLAMLDDEVVLNVLKECGVSITKLVGEITEFLNDNQHFSLLNDEEISEIAKTQFANEELRKIASENGIFYQPELSVSLQRAIQRAAVHVQSSGKKSIHAINLLVAMFNEKESHAVYFLEKQGVRRLDILEKIAHTADGPLTTGKPNQNGHDVDVDPLQKEDRTAKALEEYTVNLNKMAADGKLDPIIGRTEEIERVIQILCRRRKNNPILVGDSGVGKTAIAEGLAQLIIEGKVPDLLKNAEIYSLDMASLLAGTKFRGDFEERIKTILKALEEKNKTNETILFIDEIHTIIGAGSTSGGSMDASNLLKPALSRGTLRCMGSTTYDEYRKFFEKDQALTRRFQKIDINEPSIVDSVEILKGLRHKFAEHHEVTYSDEIIKSSVELAAKHINDKKLPDKAIDVIDEAGAYVRINRKDEELPIAMTMDTIEKIVAKIARIPEKNVSLKEKDKLKHLERDLKTLIFGQDEAITQVASAILMSRSGLGNQNKPIASFLFAGPTGVGKTELAKQLAHTMGISFERSDMSEYMEQHSVAKLIGATPGYVGFDEGGILTEKINQTPYCVLLLDEIEKAHPDVFNILLQVMDYGALSDANGKKTDFKNVILIMTSNAGAKEMESGAIGLAKVAGNIDANQTKRDQALKNTFTPEFRNRLDAIIHFRGLNRENILSIVDKFIMELEEQLIEKKIELEVTDELKAWITDHGYDPKMGARPLARLINDEIRKPLSSEILFGKLEKGGRVRAYLQQNVVKFEYLDQ